VLRLFTFVISLIVVGAALFLASRIAIGGAPKPDKPATPVARSASGRQVAVETTPAPAVTDAETDVRIGALRRVRSGVLLVIILTALGLIAGLVILVVGALVLNGLRSAVQ
jgi:hypothetical protein